MGAVYRATDTVLGRQVAIKILPADVAADPEWVARFRREAQALAALNHPNVGAIYGFEALDGRTGSAFGLVLELVEGATLAEKLDGRPFAGRRSVGDRTADCRGVGRRSSARDRPPRSETRQHQSP